MGQQQLLLIILGVIIVGIAIAVGLQLFQAGSVGANQDAMQNDMMNIAAHAQQHFVRPASMGGGNGSFDGSNTDGDVVGQEYLLPVRLEETGNGTYTVETAPMSITITGISVPYPDSEIELVYTRVLGDAPDTYVWTFSGQFE
jgi:hypothetical protein